MTILLRYLKNKLLDAPDPSHEMFYYASRISLVALLSLLVYNFMPISQAGWLVASAVFITACARGKTHSLRLSLLICSCLYLIGIGLFITLLAQSTWLFLLFIIIVVLIGYHFIPTDYDVGTVIVLNLIFTFFIGGFPGELSIAWPRFISMAIGCGIGFLGAYVFFPYRPRQIVRRLTHVIEQKNIFYLQWVFTDCICGNMSSTRLDSFRHEIFSHIQEAWQFLLHYPDPLHLKVLNDQMDLFGQVGVLARLLFEPIQQNSLIRMFPVLDELRKEFFDLSKEKYKNHILDAVIQQKILARLKQLEQQYLDNQDIQSVCYVLERLVDLIIKGKVDETRAFA